MKHISQVLILCLVLGGAATSADEDPLMPAEEAAVERILELQRQIDELLGQLSPALQEEVRRRLARRAAATEVADVALSTHPQAPEPPAESISSKENEIAAVSPPAASIPLPVAPAPVAPSPSRRRRSTCNTLIAFDENQDGRLSALDRYWRHLYLWRDRNGNSALEEPEVRSAYDLGAREIAIDLETFVDKKGRLHEVRRGRQLIFDLRGDGFAESRGSDDAVLVIDASALGRGDGPQILDRSGAVLDGLQPFREGLQVRLANGELITLDCP